MVLTRITRTVENILFSTIPVRGLKQVCPITWLVHLGLYKDLARTTNWGLQLGGR